MKVTKFACMVCALGALFLVSSCNKQKEETTTFNITTPEWQSDDDTRVYIDFTLYRQYWNKFDEVMVYNLDFENAGNSVFDVFRTGASAEGKVSASFNGSVGAVKDGYFTFYPAQMAGCVDGAEPAFNEENREEFTVPAEQNFTTFKKNGQYYATIDPNSVAMCHNPETLRAFTFQYIFGMLDFSLKGDEGMVVERIELIDNAFNLSGTTSLLIPNVDTDKLSQLINFIKNDQTTTPEFANLMMTYVMNQNAAEGGLGWDPSSYTDHTNTLTLNCVDHPEIRTLADVNKSIHFYMGIRPGALGEGFGLKIYFQGDQAVYVTHYLNRNPAKCSKPGMIRTIEPPFLNPANYTGIDEPYSYGVWGDWAEIEAM